MPGLILGGAQHCFQGLWPYCAVLVHTDPIFQESPRPINDLRSGFGLQCFLGAWNLVRHHVNVVWGAPLQLAVLLNPLLALDDVLMHHRWILHL